MQILNLSILALHFLIAPAEENSAARAEAVHQITIYRDAWGVPHIYGPTDASVAFGAGYAQAEDNWPQVEDNFMRAIGRGSEVHGEPSLLDDYLAHGLEINQRSVAEYKNAPDSLRALYDAYAAGINAYLAKQPAHAKRFLQHIEPWYTLALIRFKYHHNEYLSYAGLDDDDSKRALKAAVQTEASGNDFGTRIDDLPSLAFAEDKLAPNGEYAMGSNQWALAGSRTASGYPMLLINPHVSPFGLSTYTEVHLESEQGLSFSGLTRFGFMLPYMGNNNYHGWAYTDNYGDHGDLYIEKLNAAEDAYRYDGAWRNLTIWTDSIRVRKGDSLHVKSVAYRKTHHGPILGITEDGRPLSVRLAKLDEGGWFAQWYDMMRAKSLQEFRSALSVLNVPYMNTMYADADGNIMYVYNHAIPRRDPNFDWRKPVDGSISDTEWRGYHALDDLPQILNPASGFLQNCNSTPFLATTGMDLKRKDYPAYMVGGETDNRRAQNSRRVLTTLQNLTLDEFAVAALDRRLSAAEEWLPVLGDAILEAAQHDSTVAAANRVLNRWDHIAEQSSVATTLFVLWAQKARPHRENDKRKWVKALQSILSELEEDWGTWRVPWGEINRIQRPDAAGKLPFLDARPSEPVSGAPGWLGSVFTFHARKAEDGMKHYGVHGNSFVKVVEFTPNVRARSVFVFGQSGHPMSPHFFDQARLYSANSFKPAWQDRDQVVRNARKIYHLALPAAIKAK